MSAVDTPYIPAGFDPHDIVAAGDEAGINWVTSRPGLFGAVNGYAMLPDGHPWRDLDLQCADYGSGPDVHGGITYGPTPEGWVGFDYLHSSDIWPGSPEYMQRMGGVARTESEVEAEAKSLARQIAAAA